MRTIPGFDTKLAVLDFDKRTHSRKSVPLTVKTPSLRGFQRDRDFRGPSAINCTWASDLGLPAIPAFVPSHVAHLLLAGLL